MKLKIGEKELNVKFGYEATLKTRLLSRMAKMAVEMQNAEGSLEKIEDMLLFIPEALVVGLQKENSNEFGFNLDTKEGYEEKKNKVFELVSELVDSGEVDCLELFTDIEQELTKNGFLKKMFEKEVKKELQKVEN